ncbi:MAG: alpha/beta hydrolase [Blastocatellia bacterium]
MMTRASPHYRCQGSGPLLIYVAGLDGTGELFFKQAPLLARSYRVVTFRSRDDGRFTYEDLTGDIAAIIRELGEQKATIVGESFGGTVALSFALRYPAMLEQLVVINSFPRFRKRFKIKLGAILASRLPFGLLWPVRRTASILGLLVDGVSRQDRRVFWKAVRTVSGEAYARRLRLIADFDVEHRLSEIQTPTLLVGADRDLLIPSVREAHAMADVMPNATVKVIEGAGHACLLGRRIRLDELLAEWRGAMAGH